MASGIDISTVAVRGRALYVCMKCGVRAAGDAVELTMTEVSNSSLARAARDIGNHAMPVGWAGYGTGAHKCPACQT